LLDKKPSSGKTLPELDGLRGFAVFLVLASHSNLFHLRGQGAVGVWLFFVLSGFLLTTIMLAKTPASLGGRELTKYVVRRIARIIPPYYVCLALITMLDGKPGSWLFRHFTFRLADGHFWSIPQEELFYLLLPGLVAVIYLVKRWLRLPMFLTAGALLLVVTWGGFPSFSLPGNGSRVFFYINIFMVGFFLAQLWRLAVVQRLLAAPWFVPIAHGAGAVCVLIMLFGAKEQMAFYQQFFPRLPARYLGWEHSTTFAALCAILLLATLTPGSWSQRVFSWRGFRVVGVLSFGLYLVHFYILLNLTAQAGLAEGFLLFTITATLSLVAALFLERFVERPSMRLGRRINARIGSTAPARETPGTASAAAT
jgi:peptidoglycan/LPS O-acetylase OafA/YrhL